MQKTWIVEFQSSSKICGDRPWEEFISTFRIVVALLFALQAICNFLFALFLQLFYIDFGLILSFGCYGQTNGPRRVWLVFLGHSLISPASWTIGTTSNPNGVMEDCDLPYKGKFGEIWEYLRNKESSEKIYWTRNAQDVPLIAPSYTEVSFFGNLCIWDT